MRYLSVTKDRFFSPFFRKGSVPTIPLKVTRKKVILSGDWRQGSAGPNGWA
jgi:hypothetical protein